MPWTLSPDFVLREVPASFARDLGWRLEAAWIGGFVWDSNINLAISAAAMSNLPGVCGVLLRLCRTLAARLAFEC